MALGAQRGNVLRTILSEAAGAVFLGIGLGMVASLGATQIVRNLLFGVTSTDPVTFTFAVFLVLLVTAIAAFFPARHAASADPVIALRTE